MTSSIGGPSGPDKLNFEVGTRADGRNEIVAKLTIGDKDYEIFQVLPEDMRIDSDQCNTLLNKLAKQSDNIRNVFSTAIDNLSTQSDDMRKNEIANIKLLAKEGRISRGSDNAEASTKFTFNDKQRASVDKSLKEIKECFDDLEEMTSSSPAPGTGTGGGLQVRQLSGEVHIRPVVEDSRAEEEDVENKGVQEAIKKATSDNPDRVDIPSPTPSPTPTESSRIKTLREDATSGLSANTGKAYRQGKRQLKKAMSELETIINNRDSSEVERQGASKLLKELRGESQKLTKERFNSLEQSLAECAKNKDRKRILKNLSRLSKLRYKKGAKNKLARKHIRNMIENASNGINPREDYSALKNNLRTLMNETTFSKKTENLIRQGIDKAEKRLAKLSSENDMTSANLGDEFTISDGDIDGLEIDVEEPDEGNNSTIRESLLSGSGTRSDDPLEEEVVGAPPSTSSSIEEPEEEKVKHESETSSLLGGSGATYSSGEPRASRSIARPRTVYVLSRENLSESIKKRAELSFNVLNNIGNSFAQLGDRTSRVKMGREEDEVSINPDFVASDDDLNVVDNDSSDIRTLGRGKVLWQRTQNLFTTGAGAAARAFSRNRENISNNIETIRADDGTHRPLIEGDRRTAWE